MGVNQWDFNHSQSWLVYDIDIYTHINVTKKSNEAHIQILDDTLLGFTSSHEIGSTGTVWVTWAAVKIRAMLACVVGQQSPTSLLVDCNVG